MEFIIKLVMPGKSCKIVNQSITWNDEILCAHFVLKKTTKFIFYVNFWVYVIKNFHFDLLLFIPQKGYKK